MSIQASIAAIELSETQETRGEGPKYSGTVKIAISHHRASHGPLTLDFPFKNVPSLDQAMADALKGLAAYGSDIGKAALEALVQHGLR